MTTLLITSFCCKFINNKQNVHNIATYNNTTQYNTTDTSYTNTNITDLYYKLVNDKTLKTIIEPITYTYNYSFHDVIHAFFHRDTTELQQQNVLHTHTIELQQHNNVQQRIRKLHIANPTPSWVKNMIGDTPEIIFIEHSVLDNNKNTLTIDSVNSTFSDTFVGVEHSEFIADGDKTHFIQYGGAAASSETFGMWRSAVEWFVQPRMRTAGMHSVKLLEEKLQRDTQQKVIQ